MMKNVGFFVCLIGFICLGIAGCNGGSSLIASSQQPKQTSAATLVSIKIVDASSVTATAEGTTLQLSAVGTFSDGSTSTLTSQVTWTSSDATIASISTSGLLTAVKPGPVAVTATQGTVTGSMTITVSPLNVAPPTLTSITVTAPFTTLAAGSSEQLAAQGAYSDNSNQTLTSQVTWQSSDSTIATTSSSGLLTALKAGAVTISATMGTVSGTISVVVPPPPPPPVGNTPTLSSITIIPSSFSIASSQTKQLLVQGVFSDGTTQDVTTQVAWSSSATNIVTLSAAGVATGVSTGSVIVTATLGSISATANATVTGASLTAITVRPSTASIATGQTQLFTADGVFSDGSSTDMTNSVAWSSSDTNIATINPTGLATGVTTGSTSISATSGTVTGSASLTVTPATLGSLDISPDGQSIPIGGQYQLMLTGSYSDNTTQTIANATWSSSDPTVVSIDKSTGIVTGVANSNGTPVTITASAYGLTTTTTVFVTAATIESLTLTPETTSLASGTTLQYAANAVFSDGTIQPLSTGLSWTSSSPAIAGIGANGMASAISPGQATITVSYSGLTGTATLTVTPAALASIVVVSSSQTIGIGGNAQFTATGVFTDNTTQDLTSQVTWSSSTASVAVISSTGLASALSAGTTNITANYQGVSGSAPLSVTTATLLSISITPANSIVPPSTRIQMTAIGSFSDGTQALLSGVSWYTATGRYATVSSSGVLRTKKATNQTVQIYVTLNGVTGQTSVTITSMQLQSLQITPANSTIAVGTTQSFKLIGTFSDGLTTVDLSKSAQWQTSNYKYAVINTSGVATGVSSGSITVTGSYGNLAPATATLTVSNATIQSIAVTPPTPTIVLGGVQQFTATGSFSDGSTQDLTALSQWTSSAPAVAVVNQSGLANSASHGNTNIVATFKGLSNAATLTIN